MALLTASQLSLIYGEVEIFTDIDLQVDEGARIGLVGPNGGGKTSLIRMLLGEITPNAGTISWARNVRTGYVPQKPEQSGNGSLRDEVMMAFEKLLHLEDQLASSGLEIQNSEGEERRQAERLYSSLLNEYEALGGYDYINSMEQVVDGVGLSQEALQTPVTAASGGQRTRAALARALLSEPDFLVLDEPTNYLDFKGLDWIEGFLSKSSLSFLVVSHDRYFLDKVATQIWDLERGRLKSYPGNFSKYRVQKEEQLKRQLIEYERQQEYIQREEYFIARYHAGQRSREARGRATRLERLERIEKPESQHTVKLSSVRADRTGHIVLNTHNLSVGFQDNGRSVQLLSVPNIQLERQSKTAIIGANGEGKTTFLNTILGYREPLAGSVNFGHNVEPGYYTQGSIDLPNHSTVIDAFLDAKHIPLGEARNFLALFLFRGDDVYKSVSALSGGERSRLALARLLITEPNVLVLDEPTTHLDIPSREALEQALQSYNGTLLFVSHDRRLISLLADQLLIVEDGTVSLFPYGFEEWVTTRQGVGASQQSHSSKVSTSVKKRPVRKNQSQKKNQVKEAKPDYESLITELEAELSKVEQQLEKASAQQNIEEVAKLGEQYTEIQTRLSEMWAKWES